MKFKPIKTKNLITIFGGLILASILFLNNGLAYSDKTTHPDLTREIIDFYELSTGKKLTDEQKQWIVQGSIDEDKAPRWINHFYDPIFGRGLDDMSVFSIYGIAGYPAKKWAQLSSYQSINPENVANMWTGKGPVVSGSWWGDFSYEAAVKNYSENKEKEAYVSLGHILHLIEDMTVPEHTRNDAHPGGNISSRYENWAKENSASLTRELGKKLFVKGSSPIIYTDLESYFNNLATYTNTHFFSPRTIKSEIYLKPKIVFEDGTFAYGVDERGEYFDLAIYITDKSLKKVYSIEDKHDQVMQEYWLRLSRQAVVNGAGVIQLFLNQAEVAKGKQSKPKSSLISQILNFFRSPDAPMSEPALVITSEPRRDVGAQPVKLSPKIVKQEIAAKPVAVQKPALAQPKPAPSVTTPNPAPVSVPAPAPTPAPQVSAPVIYGGSGGGGSSSNTQQTTQQDNSTSNNATTTESLNISTFNAGDLVINEIMYDLGGDLGDTDTNREWIELYNKSLNEIDLTGWKFNDGDDATNHGLNVPPDHGGQGSMVLPASGYIVIAEHAQTFLTDHSGYAGAVIDTAEMNLKNASSTVTTLKIIASNGTTIDEVTYYNSWGANGDGKTLERKSDGNWGISSTSGGTPGAANNWELSTSDVDNSATTTPIGLGTDVSATTTITANTAWTLAGSPYRLFFDGQRRPTVAAGAVLTIEPGVKIIPQGGNYTAMEIQGTLNAIATSGAPIIFTSINDSDDLASTTPYAGEWLNIAFSAGSQGNLDYVEFRYGGQGNTLPLREMVDVRGAIVNISHSTFTNSQNTALHLVDSSGLVENSIFSDNNCGISIDSSNGIANTSYAGCYGVHTTGQILSAAPQIRNNQFIRNQLIGVEVRSGTAPIIDTNIFTDNGYPIKIESSYPAITNSQINNSTTSPNILKGIAISGYTHFSQNFTLKNDPQLPYILETNGPAHSPYIDAGATLTLEPGVILKPDNPSTPVLFVYGNLIASTTPDNPIVFTSLKDDARGGDTNGDGSITSPQDKDWANIKFLAGSIGTFVNAIFSYGGFGYVALPPPPPTELAIENFDGYSIGALSGQGDWGGGNPSSEISVVNSFAHDGANSVSLSSGGGGAYTYRTLAQPITENGVLSFWVYYTSLGNQSVSFANSIGNLIASIYYDYNNNNCSTSDGNCWALTGDGGIGHFTRTNIQTTVNSWHFMELEISFSNQKVRMRQDSGEWSNWVGSNRTNLGRIRFDRGTGDVFYDTFVYHLLTQTSPQNPALSIDAGATVVVQ